MQCFENFEGGKCRKCPPGCAHVLVPTYYTLKMAYHAQGVCV